MNARKIVIRGVAAVIGVPVVVGLTVGVSFYALMSAYAPNHTNGAIVSSGQAREYLLYVPRSYDPAKPTPLVISMHAAALWPLPHAERGGPRVQPHHPGGLVREPLLHHG